MKNRMLAGALALAMTATLLMSPLQAYAEAAEPEVGEAALEETVGPAELPAEEASEEVAEAPTEETPEASAEEASEASAEEASEEVAEAPTEETPEAAADDTADDAEESEEDEKTDEKEVIHDPYFSTDGDVQYGTFELDEDPEELQEAYLNEELGLSYSLMTLSVGEELSGINAGVYQQLIQAAALIADGSTDSSVISIPVSAVGMGGRYSASDLGLSSFYEGGTILEDAIDTAIDNKWGTYERFTVIRAAIRDCPYEFYWAEHFYAANSPMHLWAVSYDSDAEDYYLTFTDSFLMRFFVGDDYALAGSYYTATISGEEKQVSVTLDTTKTAVAAKVKETVAKIVAQAQSSCSTDYDILKYYLDQVVALTDYNYAAVSDDYTGDDNNPWQLIWVFDGDSSTKVVCEGYSKAFQYLCERTVFQNSAIWCYSVTGTAYFTSNSGGHMWNIVHMEDGNNYLVDVTNCDNGTTASTDLFLAPAKSGSVASGYVVGKYSYKYVYYQDIIDLYAQEDLTLSTTAYSGGGSACTHDWGTGVVTTEATCAATGVRTYTCSLCKATKTQTIDKDPDNHTGETEIRDAKEATCSKAGYSGDTYCKGCGIKLSSGETIPATGKHDWDDGVVTTEPTISTTGVKTYTCKVCEATKEETIDKLTQDQAIEVYVTRLYKICLGRTPDAEGLKNWTDGLKSGEATGAGVAYGFLFSDEFKNKNYCNSCYVTVLYQTMLGRTPDSAGLQSWVSTLRQGTDRESVFNGFIGSDEFTAICASYGITRGDSVSSSGHTYVISGTCPSCGATIEDKVSGFVTRLYNICLDRNPDTAGLRDWVFSLKSGATTGTKVAYGFVFSSEFQGKNYDDATYVEYMYKAMLGRSSDPAGKSSWVSQLAQGTSRESVFYGFAGSDEFGNICSEYGITR